MQIHPIEYSMVLIFNDNVVANYFTSQYNIDKQLSRALGLVDWFVVLNIDSILTVDDSVLQSCLN